ncbi:MAG: transglutaminase domain-containing protein [archaeon]
MRKALIASTLILLLCLPFFSRDLQGVQAQKAINKNDAMIRYSIFLKSNYTTPHNITFLWNLRQTEWSTAEMVSSTPALSGSGYFDSGGDVVSKDDFVAFQAFGWRFDRVAPDDIVHVDFLVRVQVSAFSPSTLNAKDVGTIDDVTTQLSKKELGRYLNESYYWDYQSVEVKTTIDQIKKQAGASRNVYDIVRKTLMWFAANTMYSYPYEFDYPTGRVRASEFLKQSLLGRHYGLCRHYVDLFVAVMRGLGVPCLMEEGLVLADKDGLLDVVGRHAWAVVYFPGAGWRRIDVTVPDRSTLDLIGIGLSPYPWYYAPEYIEYTNQYPTVVEGTMYPYMIIGGSIKVEETLLLPSLKIDGVLSYGTFALVLVLVALVLMTRARVKRIENQLRLHTEQDRPATVPRFCAACGAARLTEATFCANCGKRFI